MLHLFKASIFYVFPKLRFYMIVDEEGSHPIVNGCYLDANSEMFKVRMLSYLGKQINHIVIEDTCGNLKTIDIPNWKDMSPIPCCISSNTRQQQKNLPA